MKLNCMDEPTDEEDSYGFYMNLVTSLKQSYQIDHSNAC
jgi:hypothetical protein